MIGLSHYRECGLYDATLMTGKLVSRSKQIDSELSDFRSQLNELMQSFNTVMWPDVRWQSIWHWCKVIWCPQNDPGGNKTRKTAIKVHNKRTTGSIHMVKYKVDLMLFMKFNYCIKSCHYVFRDLCILRVPCYMLQKVIFGTQDVIVCSVTIGI